MFDWLCNLLGLMLSFFNSITGSYALALLFYALVFKIVLLPFNIKQQKNQVKSAKLTPKIEIIKAKYKGRKDPQTMQKMQQEIMELQQKEGASPLSGCLPLLIQLPIIMLLYTVIQNVDDTRTDPDDKSTRRVSGPCIFGVRMLDPVTPDLDTLVQLTKPYYKTVDGNEKHELSMKTGMVGLDEGGYVQSHTTVRPDGTKVKKY